MIFGIDTASVGGNKDPNWVQAKAEGPISFAIIRSNYGEQEDTTFKRDWPRIADAGMVRGVYLFLRFPRGGKSAPAPAAQAQAVIQTVGDLTKFDLPPTVDVEFPGDGRVETGLSAQECLDRVRACCKVLQDHYGVAPLLYTSARVWRDDLKNLPAPDLVESPLWLARYFFPKGPAARDAAAFADGRLDPAVPPSWGDANWWIHQYQGDAVQCPGFSTGNVDMNRFNPMYRGAVGERVKWVQRRLNIPPKGKFDAATDAALRDFQAKNGLVADGVIGPRTFARLCWISVG
ncbi:MAG TPA: GH25 family lysozyme [Polyangia bacterium]|nr:GH25 family lysozyme [Polyangia bacterium]